MIIPMNRVVLFTCQGPMLHCICKRPKSLAKSLLVMAENSLYWSTEGQHCQHSNGRVFTFNAQNKKHILSFGYVKVVT